MLSILSAPLNFLFFSYFAKLSHDQGTPFFQDVTKIIGLPYKEISIRYGGPIVFDLNDDGFHDIMITHHDMNYSSIWLYNSISKQFQKTEFKLWTDMHGISAIPRSPWSRNMRFSISSGGAWGQHPSNPRLYEWNHDVGNFSDVSSIAGIDKHSGRGRKAIFLNLAGKNVHSYCSDVIFTNAKVLIGKGPQQVAYECQPGGRFIKRPLVGYSDRLDDCATVTDMENDGIMELLSFQNFSIQRMVAPFHFKDVTSQVLDIRKEILGVVGITEIDYDNDGDMDLYLSRTVTGDLHWLRTTDPMHDILLENRNGKYHDVSVKAGIPRLPESRGASVGDLNNDGLLDLVVVQYKKPDVILMNLGNSTFKAIENTPRRSNTTCGDMVQVFDYDQDGYVDLVVTDGDRNDRNLSGPIRVLKNMLPQSPARNWLIVWVGNSPTRSATALHAIVKIEVGSGKSRRMTMLRVGNQGTSISESYNDILNFGLGRNLKANKVTVTWSNGQVMERHNIGANQKIVMGLL